MILKRYPKERRPYQGETKWVKRFAWVPTKVCENDMVLIWLEAYYAKMAYDRDRGWTEPYDIVDGEIVYPQRHRAVVYY